MKEYTSNHELIQTLLDYDSMRNKIKKPMTDRALKGILTKLDKLASTDDYKIVILEQSIEKCYTGVFEVKSYTETPNEGYNIKDSSDMEVEYLD